MSKSLQKGILFAVCILLVCALGVTLFIFDGTGGAVTGQEGQASNVAQNKNTTTYTHGSYIERDVPSGVRQVNKGTDFVDAVSKDQDISITGSFELTSAQSFLKKDNNGKISDDPATSGTALVYSGTIYGNGYNITITGSQDISNNSAVWDCGPNGYGDAANVYGGLVGKLTGQIYDLNVTMKSGTMEKIKGNDGGDRWLDVGVIAGIVDDTNARIENCSVTIPANTQITALKSPISNVGWGQSSAGTQYVRAAGIAAELNNGTIVNCTVTNNGCISAGLQENKDDNSITNGYYGAAANAVAWVNNGTLNNIIVKGSGKLIGLKTAAISVVNNSNNSPTTNAYNGYTGTYEFRHGDDGGNWSTASMYVSGARQAIANFYQASNATTRGGTNKDQTSYELANSGTTLTVNPSTYTIYFDPTKSSDDTRLAVLFNNENYSAGAEYELYGASSQISNAQISGANGKVLARNLTASPATWNSGNNFTASVQIAFDPTSYAKLTKYDHGYVDPDNRTTNGTAIGTGEAFEAEFSPSGTISGTDYYLTNDIVITGFTGKEFSGTLDGNGHTIFITGANTCAAQHIGGIVGTLTGTIKNVRVVLVNSVTANTSVSNANVGLVAGHINGGSLINVSVDIPTNVTLSHVGTANDSSLGGIAGSAVSGATFTKVTMNFNGTLSNTRNNDYWPYTSAFVGKPYFKDSANSSANCATFNNIIIRGNGTFASQSNSTTEPPYYAAIGIIQHKGVTDSTAAVYNVNGLIYDFNPQFANDQGATTGNHGACYGLFVNNNNNNATQVQYYDRLVNYGSNGVYNASGAVIEAYAFNENGNAPVPNPSKIKNITETVTNVTGSAVKAYFMPGDSASENLTLVASASNWNGVTQLQLDGAAPAVTSADDGSNKVVNVAKSTAVSISGENLTLSPYNPYTVITASLDNPSKVYDGNPFAAQVSFTDSTGAVTLTAGDDYNITYTDGGNTGETNANVGDGTYSLTVTLKGTASDGTQYVFDAQGTKTKTFTYTITPYTVNITWGVKEGSSITYGDPVPTEYNQYLDIQITNGGTIPGGLTATDITGSGFTSNYTSGTRAGETVTITAGTFTVGSGFTASNYNFSGITGSGSLEVQKKELTISESFGDSMGHITDNYGENVTTFEALADLFEAEGMSYVEGLYGSDVVTFTVTALTYDRWYNDGADGAWEFNADASSLLSGRLYGNTAYNVGVTLASDNSVNDNYELTNSIFVYAILPLPITVTGVELDGFDGDYIYDGNAHNISVTYDGALQGDELTFGISVSYGDQPFDGTALTNAGEYTIDVSFDPQNAFHGEVNYNYDIGVDGSENTPYTLTISPKTLTPTDIRGTFTEYTSFNLPTGASFVTSGILESDSEVTVAVTSWVNDPSTNVVGSGSYVAVNTYTANLAIQGDTNNNYTLSADTATFTIKPYDLANATITVNTEGITAYTGSEQTVGVTVMAGTADITDLVTITGNTETNAGNGYTVSISSKDSNTTASKNADTTWSIAKADYNMEGVTFENDSITYDGESHTLTISEDSLPTGEDGIKVTVTYSATSGDVNITNVGSVEITATFATTSTNYNTPAVKTATLTIEKANYDMTGVTFTDSTIPYDGKSHTLTVSGELPTGADDIQVTVTYSEESGDVNITNVGSVKITATFATTSTNYNTPAANTATLTIEKKAVTVTWEIGDIIKGTDPDKVKATAEVTNNGGILDGDEYTFTVTLPLKDGSGDYTTTTPEGTMINVTPSLTFTDPTDGGNYDITYNPEFREWTVQLPEVKISVTEDPVDKTYAAGFVTEADFLSNFTGTFTATAANADLTSDNFDITITKQGEGEPTAVGVGRLDVGTYTVAISAAADSQYTIADGSTLTYTYTVNPTVVEITWAANGDLVYNGQAHTLTATITNKVETDNVTAIVEKHSGDNINVAEGGFAFTITGLENNEPGNYTIDGAENLTSQAFYIRPATLTVVEKEGATLSREYDGNTTAANSFLTADFLTVTGNAPSDDIYAMLTATVGENKAILNAGTYSVTIAFNSAASGASNYSVGDFSGIELTYTVERKVITVTFGGHENLTYTASAHQITATVTDSINNDVTDLTGLVAISGTGTSALNAGSYTATVSKTAVEGEYPNYTLADDATQEFTIAQATLTLTEKEGASLSKVYDGKVVDPQSLLTPVNVTVAGMQNGEDAFELGILSIAPEADSEIKSAAGYKLTVSVNEGNYTADDLELTYTVTAKLIGVEWSNTQFTYDGAVHKPTATAKNLVGDETLTLTVTGEQTNASESPYTATVAKSSVTGNYMLEEDATVEFTIAPKPISVEWSNTTLTYNGSEQKPNAAIAAGALIGDDKVEITVEGAQINANTDGAYTATAVITGGDDRGNYTLDSTATTSFTIAPATLNVSVAIAGDGVADNKLTWNVEAEVTVSGNSEDGWTLTSGGTSYIVTVTGADGVASDVLQLTLNGSEYTGTPYGTRVQNGELGVASTNPNYKVVATPIIINIEPDISIEINTGAEYPDSAVYSKDKTYTADDFAGYFSIDGQTEGTWAYSVEGVESGSFSNVGTYTVKATFTITASSIQLENHFTFNITQATVTGVVLNGGGAYTYGGLKAGDTVSVKVTYSDGNTATVNAGFEAAASTGGYVNAGNRVTLTLGSAADEDPNYESVAGQTITDLSIAKKDITAEIFYAETEAVKGVLTLPYNGSEGYVISARPVNVLDGDGVDVTVETEITNAATYSNLSLVLGGNDAANYNLTGTDSLSVVVNPVQAEVNWTVGEYTYNGSAQQPEASATGVNEDVALNITITSDTTDGAAINAGSYTATASTTNTNYTLTNTTCEFTIGKANVSLSIAGYDNIKNKVYDGNAVTITPNAVFAGTQTEATGAAALVQVLITDITDYDNPVTADAVKNAGAYTVELRLTEGGENINFANASEYFTFTISKASVSVRTTTTTFTYDGNAVDIDAMGASASTIYDNEATLVAKATLNGEPAEMKNAGTYSVTFTLEGEGAGNYELTTTAPVSVTINARVVTISWTEDETFTYNGEAQLPTASVTTDDGLVDGDTIDLSGAVTLQGGGEAINANADGESYTAVVTVEALEAANPNYTMSVEATTDFAIAPRQVEITWMDETFIYNGSAQAPTFTVNNLVEGDELELTAAITGNVTNGEAINAGDYIATIAAFEEGNYTLASASTKTFNIGKANLTLTPASVTFSEKDENSLAAYSQSSYEATIKDKVTVTGVAGKIADYTVTTEATFDGTTGYLVTDGENAGTYTFTITASANYNTATFTVTVTEQQTITITATPSSGTYTGEEITFEYEPSDLSVDISGLTITVATVNGSADGAVLNAGSYTVTFNVSNSDEAGYCYVVSDWTGTIAAAEVTVTEATLSAIYGEVYTAATGVAVQNVNGWSVATFNGAPVEATVAINQTAAAAALPGETIYLSASETAYNVIITLTSDNFKFADTVSVSGNSKQMATTLTVEKKDLDVTTPTDLTNLTYTSEGVVIEIADISEDIVGSDDVTVTIMVDGELYEPGVTVLSAGEHTITYAISGNGNYAISADSAVGQTFTIAPKAASDSITVSGETVESGGTVEITTGENLRVDTAINNYIAQNGVAEGEYTVTATDSQGNEVDIDRVSSWAPGDYTISVNLGENFSGGEMTFTISVAAGTTTEIPDPPTTPSTPIVDDGGSGNNWLFPLIIAIECVIALALIAAIVITAIKRSKNA